MTEPIMIFKVYADPEECSDMRCPYGGVSFIPFTATVESELFCGKTLPGACDVEIRIYDVLEETVPERQIFRRPESWNSL